MPFYTDERGGEKPLGWRGVPSSGWASDWHNEPIRMEGKKRFILEKTGELVETSYDQFDYFPKEYLPDSSAVEKLKALGGKVKINKYTAGRFIGLTTVDEFVDSVIAEAKGGGKPELVAPREELLAISNPNIKYAKVKIGKHVSVFSLQHLKVTNNLLDLPKMMPLERVLSAERREFIGWIPAGKYEVVSMFYFAYGSNMDPQQMEERGAQFIERKRAVLNGYHLKFNKKATEPNAKMGEGKGNIEAYAQGKVEGALYIISKEGLPKLDAKEGYPYQYDRSTLELDLDDGTKVKALVYIAQPNMIEEGLKPTKEYLAHYLEGKDLLSPEYYGMLKNIETLD